MRIRLICLAIFGSIIAPMVLYHPGNALATTAEGYKSTSLAVGRFAEVDAIDFFPHGKRAEEDSKQSSDVYVQTNVWQPGGSTGWHSHPGHSLIIVTAGTVTNYEGNDPNCTPHVYTKGMGFVDSGGDHAHLVRNEGNGMASTIAVQLIPAGVARRIDVPDPGSCHF